jgi:hypothetical protein
VMNLIFFGIINLHCLNYILTGLPAVVLLLQNVNSQCLNSAAVTVFDISILVMPGTV